MALRATSGPTLASTSFKVGDIIRVSAKVENTAATDASVALAADGSPHPLLFEPSVHKVRAKSRAAIEFTARAGLPDGVDAKTLRGKLVLRDADSGALVGGAPMDIYVRRAGDGA